MKQILLKLKTDKRYKVIVWGLLVHCLLLSACFDLYFSSPLDRGMQPIRSTSNPPAKRLVLYVADGLRAEAIYNSEITQRIPFLSNITKHHGSWGISHTRVPTESRPGHVAMLAGIYEDPSAIMKGWKANPVDFDSVINQSSNAFCWGSPDIVNIFNRDNLPHIHLATYGAEMEDFGKQDSSSLDLWVFERVEKYLDAQKSSPTRLDESGTVFFLHLLGIDTAGHGFKPHSPEYVNNIKLVDENVEKMTKLFDEVYNDGLTSYIFTADHGMTDWGSHGAGTPHETESPIIAWGAGIGRNPDRQDLNQIDLAPLLAALIGINIPINSLGIIPQAYLNVAERNLAEMLIANTKQLLAIFNVKRLRTQENAIIFVPFEDGNVQEKLLRLEELLGVEDFVSLKRECQDFIRLLIRGLDYYHNYYQLPILIYVSVGFLAWIFFLGLNILAKENSAMRRPLVSNKIFIALSLIVASLCYKQNFPPSYYLYFLFPVVMFYLLAQEKPALNYFSHLISKVPARSILVNLSFYLIGIQLLIFGFFHRVAFSVLMVLVGLWILFSETLRNNSTNGEKLLWLICCCVLAVFPSLPVMKTTFNVPVYILGFLAWLGIFSQMYLKTTEIYRNSREFYKQLRIFFVQFLCLLAAGCYNLLLEFEIIANDSNIKYLSWIMLLVPIILIPFTSKLVVIRLVATFFAFAPFYLLVSPNFEALFAAFYVATLVMWLLIESKSFFRATELLYYKKFDPYTTKNSFDTEAFRRGFLFMVFIFVGFFGTGNIASLNSFDPMWVRAFLTVFSPFKMMGLILLKIMVPFIFTCCIFRAINSIAKENVLSMFCIILMFSDIMVLQFLYLITNEGSWLDIGTSLSHFIIMEGFVTILLVLYGFAQVITTVSYC